MNTVHLLSNINELYIGKISTIKDVKNLSHWIFTMRDCNTYCDIKIGIRLWDVHVTVVSINGSVWTNATGCSHNNQTTVPIWITTTVPNQSSAVYINLYNSDKCLKTVKCSAAIWHPFLRWLFTLYYLFARNANECPQKFCLLKRSRRTIHRVIVYSRIQVSPSKKLRAAHCRQRPSLQCGVLTQLPPSIHQPAEHSSHDIPV